MSYIHRMHNHRKLVSCRTSSHQLMMNFDDWFVTEQDSDIPDIENVMLDLAKEHHALGAEQKIFFFFITVIYNCCFSGTLSLIPRLTRTILSRQFPSSFVQICSPRRPYQKFREMPTRKSRRGFLCEIPNARFCMKRTWRGRIADTRWHASESVPPR